MCFIRNTDAIGLLRDDVTTWRLNSLRNLFGRLQRLVGKPQVDNVEVLEEGHYLRRVL